MIRVVLPYHLRTLARVSGELELELPENPTIQDLLDEIERLHPVLKGTILDHGSRKRRPFIRFFACKEDLSGTPTDQPLPLEVVAGSEPFLIVGAMAGG